MNAALLALNFLEITHDGARTWQTDYLVRKASSLLPVLDTGTKVRFVTPQGASHDVM